MRDRFQQQGSEARRNKERMGPELVTLRSVKVDTLKVDLVRSRSGRYAPDDPQKGLIANRILGTGKGKNVVFFANFDPPEAAATPLSVLLMKKGVFSELSDPPEAAATRISVLLMKKVRFF